MNTSSFANLYFTNVLNHVDSLKQEEALLAERRAWTNHTIIQLKPAMQRLLVVVALTERGCILDA